MREQGYSTNEVGSGIVYEAKPDIFGAEATASCAGFRGGFREAAALAAANKRVGNILKKVEGGVTDKVDATLLQEPAEQAYTSSIEPNCAEGGCGFCCRRLHSFFASIGRVEGASRFFL